MTRPISEILNDRKAPEASKLLTDLRSESRSASIEAGTNLVVKARDYGLDLRDFLTLAIDPRLSDNPENYRADNRFLNGYEATLQHLNLPVREDLAEGIVLQAASDTFQTFPGTRALFPEVVDDMVKFKYRQDQIEKVAPLLAGSRTISGVEMLSTVIDDKQADYQADQAIAEMARIPIRTIRTTQYSVSIYKHGMGYRTSYEFERRARIDLLTPYAARSAREIEMSKVKAATALLVNGDAVYGAPTTTAQSSWKSGATNGTLNWEGLTAWFVDSAKKGVPIDTVVGNWDAYLLWLKLFGMPVSNYSRTDSDNLAAVGFNVQAVPLLGGTINFALSSTMTAGRLLGMSKADTLEELVEAGSLISESERSIQNQTVTYVKTENIGYRLVFGDSRSVYNYNA